MIVYVATGPTGNKYVGITRHSAEKRWREHQRRAAKSDKRHPLHDAIRKFGGAAFVLETVAAGLTEPEAKTAEIAFIRELGSIATLGGYNVSAGGDYDAKSGAAAMAARLADPEFRAGYLAKLSVSKLADDWSDYAAMNAAAQEWRRNNSRTAYASAIRAARMSRSKPAERADPRFGAWGRLWSDSAKVASARRAYFTRGQTRAQWARRTTTERGVVAAKIGARLAESWADAISRPAREAQLSLARSSIDRTRQGPAASAGLKRWWAALKTDPLRYAAHIESRKRNKR